MADTLLVRALKSKPKSLNLSNKKLDRVPKAIGKLDCVVHLQLKNNKLTQLPFELSYLYQVNSVVSFRDLSQALFFAFQCCHAEKTCSAIMTACQMDGCNIIIVFQSSCILFQIHTVSQYLSVYTVSSL